MTLEELRERLLQKGHTKQELKSKVLASALDIFNNSNGEVLDFVRLENEKKELEISIKHLKREEKDNEWRIKHQEEELSKICNGRQELLSKAQREAKELHQRFLEELKNGETPEGRDTLRKAQLFIDSVEVTTKYDNTAYIAGLAAILSSGKIDALEELKKINPKAFGNEVGK